VLAKCAAPEHRDPDAEGWWDVSQACFCLRSAKYDTREKLVEFFALRYRPTPVFAAWNKEPGSDANWSEKLGVKHEWEVANEFSTQVVSAAAEEARKQGQAYCHGGVRPLSRSSRLSSHRSLGRDYRFVSEGEL
jgi:CRISPR-associated protein Csx17